MIEKAQSDFCATWIELVDDDDNVVPSYRHTNPDGSPGGLVVMGSIVPDTAFVHLTAIIGPNVTLPADAIIGEDEYIGS